MARSENEPQQERSDAGRQPAEAGLFDASGHLAPVADSIARQLDALAAHLEKRRPTDAGTRGDSPPSSGNSNR